MRAGAAAGASATSLARLTRHPPPPPPPPVPTADNLNFVPTQVVRMGAVPALVSLLRDREPEVMLPALRALGNLALHGARRGPARPLSPQAPRHPLSHPAPSPRAAENRVRLLEEGALQPLIVLSNSPHAQLRMEASRTLVNLY